MLRTVQKRLQQQMAKRGFVLRRSTDAAAVRRLIRQLRPVTTKHPLILLGPEGDGGYLVPDVLDGISVCFSPGVADNSSFEVACMERGMRILMADASVDAPNLPPGAGDFTFAKKFIGSVDGEEEMTIESWMSSSDIEDHDDLLLQMDIEGAEYRSLLAAPRAQLARFRVILVEFHDLDHLWDPWFFELASSVFSKLLVDHVPVHSHPNGSAGIDVRQGVEIPRVLELTFLRRDAAEVVGYASNFPHPLDHDNDLGYVVPLPAYWYEEARPASTS